MRRDETDAPVQQNSDGNQRKKSRFSIFLDDFDNDEEIVERDYRPIRFRRDGRLGCMGGIMYAVFIICLSISLAVFLWMAAGDVLALNKEETVATVTLPKDIFTETERDVTDDNGEVTGTETITEADIDYVASELKNQGLIEYDWLFRLYAKFSHAGEKVSPGTYELSTTYDYRALVKNMQVGSESMSIIRLTFPEGYSMAQIFKKLAENNVCDEESLYEAAANYEFSYEFLQDIPYGDSSRLEGYLFPDTYDFYQGEQASSVINKFLAAMHTKLTPKMTAECEALGITFNKALIVASMIEKEAANDSERPTIASVIYNRINAGMLLGIDATILYDYPDYDGSGITTEMLENDSPYNTRIYPGLPPTPICNPGLASIEAALNPDWANYYYYALDTETGTHRFFTNESDFSAFTETQNYDN